MSSGLTINVSSGNSQSDSSASVTISSVTLNGDAKVEETVKTFAATYSDPGITVKDNKGNTITNYKLTKTITDSSNNTVNNIMLNKTGTYTITYKVEGYATTLTRTVIVK